jgi:hypothetical protein
MALAAGNPSLLIAALQHDQDACKLRIQIARHNASRWRPLGDLFRGVRRLCVPKTSSV